MAVIAQVKQGPVIVVTTQVNVAAAAAVATVGAAVGVVFGTVQVHGAATAFSGAAVNFYVVYEIAFWHGSFVCSL